MQPLAKVVSYYKYYQHFGYYYLSANINNNYMETAIKERSVFVGDTFNIGDKVKVDGKYICVPCGYQRMYSTGEVFTRCYSCLKGMRDEGQPFIKGLGLW